MKIQAEVVDNTCNGECSRCGDCCGLFIPFNDEDIKIIKKYVKEHNIQPQNRLNVMTGGFDARCCFYDKKNKKCLIYPVRPFVCKDFTCSRQNWKQKRDEYELKAKYNSTLNKMIMATFDDKIYNDYGPIILFVTEFCRVPNKGLDSKKLLYVLNQIGRLDLLNHFNAITDNGKLVKGTDLN